MVLYAPAFAFSIQNPAAQRDQRWDEAPLAVMFADACEVFGDANIGIMPSSNDGQDSTTLVQYAADQLKDHLLPLSESATLSTGLIPTQRTYSANTMALALDACSRVLMHICEEHERQSMNVTDQICDELSSLAEKLREVCKADFMAQCISTIRSAKNGSSAYNWLTSFLVTLLRQCWVKT